MLTLYFLDKDDKVLGNTVGYRDHRTEGMDKEVYKAISLKDLYARTGIQKADYNTIYQLMAVKKKHPEYLEQAEKSTTLSSTTRIFRKTWFPTGISMLPISRMNLAMLRQLPARRPPFTS